MIISIYASLIALIFVALSARVVRGRRKQGVSLGDAGNEDMIRRIRAQANCAEYAPISLLLILMLELQIEASWPIHLCGLLILTGRALHGYALSFPTNTVNIFRILGMVTTFMSIVIASISNIIVALFT